MTILTQEPKLSFPSQCAKARYIVQLSCEQQKGVLASVLAALAERNYNILEQAQYRDKDGSMLYVRLDIESENDGIGDGLSIELASLAQKYNFEWDLFDYCKKPKVMVMVSAFGHCLNDLLFRHSISALPMEFDCVVSNHTKFQEKVEREGIDFFHMPISAETKAEQEESLYNLIVERDIDVVVLARYMQVLSDDLCKKLHKRVINIHHSFLPSFKGAKPYHRAHARGVKFIGATAHYVTADLDEGPIIEQGVDRVDHMMSVDEFVALGRDVESKVLAKALRYHLEHRVVLVGDRTAILR